ncbi:NAD-dependent epimerase/dehydratase family protein [Sorangium sp. So ce1024]|uniref:NAD-dependent epimerase/dehydratase family protein n=1 Tax=unclassified Sorangium TaxID=2621164 RepID=UPI003EFF17E0
MSTNFVTGGSGFVGRNLIAALRARGEVVRALARSDAAAAAVSRSGAEPVRGDLDDVDALRGGMAGAQVVYHAAALVQDWGPREDYLRANVAGTEHALAAARAAGVRRFVHVSTEAVLLGGEPLVNVDERRPRPPSPVGLYPLTKALAEERVVAANSPELETVVVRPRLIWGLGDTSLLPQFVEAVRAGKFMWIDGGRALTSTCHVRNLCEGMILAAEKGRGGEIYFLTDGPPIETREFVTRMLATQGVDPGGRSVPRWLAAAFAQLAEWTWTGLRLKGAPPITRTVVRLFGAEVTVNDDKARRELGYQGTVSREAGLEEMARASKTEASRSEAEGAPVTAA